MSELVSNINRRIDSIAATEKLRMLTTEEINCQSLLKQLADRIAELEKNAATAIWIHPEWGQTTLPPSTWKKIADKP